MHGRLKVKTTAEQEAEKQKERQKKLALYIGGCQKAGEKRDRQEFDLEALGISSQLLQNNPDHYTLWNFRKEIILSMKADKCDNDDEVQDMLENELHLTESCLRKNPKSYGAWNHRSWTLHNMPKPDWKKELYICGKSLQLDERNFHCWDHRRMVCGLAQENPEDELAFTLKKIQENFSNYSAWHYRSSLLPLVHPGHNNNNGPRIDEEILHKEYELVQNAAFTDPNDQSAWFYHRWLLGRAEVDLGLLSCHLDREHSFVVVVLSKQIKKAETKNIKVLVDDETVKTEWKTPGDSDYASTVWCSVLPACNNCENVNVSFDTGTFVDHLQCSNSLNTVWRDNLKTSLYSSELSAATTEVLQQELESCQQLLEMEPDNKWTLLTCVLLLRALDTVGNENTVLKYLDQLITLDSYRRNYYKDLRSKCIIENKLTTFLMSTDDALNLSQSNLTIFCHADHLVFIGHLDLSMNSLTSLQSLRHLVSLRELIADHNLIEDCSGLEALALLEVLSLNNNAIKDMTRLNVIKACPKLHQLQIRDNPVSTQDDFSSLLTAIMPSLRNVIR